MFALSALINLFSNLGWVQIEKHQVQTLVELFPIPVVLMLAVLLIPFIEELIFRFPLKYKRNYPLRAVAMAVNGQNSRTEGKVRRWWHRKYPVIFYLSAGIFAVIHFVNYDSETTLVFILPFLVLPQFILGLLMGYLRVRYNFFTGFLMHALHNALFMTIAILSLTSSEPVLSIENEQYQDPATQNHEYHSFSYYYTIILKTYTLLHCCFPVPFAPHKFSLNLPAHWKERNIQLILTNKTGICSSDFTCATVYPAYRATRADWTC